MQTPIFGTTTRLVDLGQALHRIPDMIVHARLVEDLDDLCEGASWYACVLRMDGTGALRGRSDTSRKPEQDVLDTMVDLAKRLNRDLHHDGHWIVYWADEQLGVIWRDRDGDMQFDLTFSEPWHRVKAWGAVDLAERSEAAWAGNAELRRADESESSQKHKRALGEAPPSATRH